MRQFLTETMLKEFKKLSGGNQKMAIVTMSLHPLRGRDTQQSQRVGHDHTKGGHQRQACMREGQNSIGPLSYSSPHLGKRMKVRGISR